MPRSCVPRVWYHVTKSKETYGQTRGLSNLEMKHVGKLAITDALKQAVFVPCKVALMFLNVS